VKGIIVATLAALFGIGSVAAGDLEGRAELPELEVRSDIRRGQEERLAAVLAPLDYERISWAATCPDVHFLDSKGFTVMIGHAPSTLVSADAFKEAGFALRTVEGAIQLVDLNITKEHEELRFVSRNDFFDGPVIKAFMKKSEEMRRQKMLKALQGP
jgi:hypothetical protein